LAAARRRTGGRWWATAEFLWFWAAGPVSLVFYGTTEKEKREEEGGSFTLAVGSLLSILSLSLSPSSSLFPRATKKKVKMNLLLDF
jgi:hypothetical protein